MFKSGIGVQAVIFSPNHTKVLLVKRGDFPVWTLPGGRVEKGEAARAAVVRETKEEAGLDVEILYHLKEYVIPLFPLAGNTRVFVCKRINGSLRTSKESPCVSYFPVQRLPSTLLPYLRVRIQDALLSFKQRSRSAR